MWPCFRTLDAASRCLHRLRELVDAGADGGLGHLRVAEDECRPAQGVGAEVAHRLELDAPVASLLVDGLFVVAVGELDGHVQPGRDAADGGFGERFDERLNERVASCAVAGSHAAQVAVELAAGEEVGERVLLAASARQTRPRPCV
jgi:hypothetical protein